MVFIHTCVHYEDKMTLTAARENRQIQRKKISCDKTYTAFPCGNQKAVKILSKHCEEILVIVES
jgi:hypothetical protein